ncbi:MAG: carbonic anhydrase [Rickettsiales bacterium]|nr:carbonic anhydrase [Rickettsiales bacterium]
MEEIRKLVRGYLAFTEEYQSEEFAAYRERAARQQSPKVMVIACSDSRVNPAIITKAELGEVFTVHNVANLVPPYEEGHNTHHSTSAAIEFAVCHLKVHHIVVLGHSQCGGIRALMEGNALKHDDHYSFIEPWMNIANVAKEKVMHQDYASQDARIHACEKEALLVSLENLRTFPWVAQAIDEEKLYIHAWYFDVASGNITAFDPTDQCFKPLKQLYG